MTKNKTFKIGNLNTKQFQYKGQMINYYNKLLKNSKLTVVTCEFSMKYGFICQWA